MYILLTTSPISCIYEIAICNLSFSKELKKKTQRGTKWEKVCCQEATF